MKTFKSHDGTPWAVDVRSPGASNAMIVFRHPDGSTSRKDRYNWVLSDGPEARSVTGRLSRDKVLASLDDSRIAELFRRSMAVTRADSGALPRADAVMSRG
ncbi:MAG: hypothetical protein H0X64_09275 [Gemmatimonadaceae bacterium]|nr:hypothetical protein [Gemmatimonadaceae bacterium]